MLIKIYFKFKEIKLKRKIIIKIIELKLIIKKKIAIIKIHNLRKS